MSEEKKTKWAVVFGPEGKEHRILTGATGAIAWTHYKKEAEELASCQPDGRVVNCDAFIKAYNERIKTHNERVKKREALADARRNPRSRG